MRILFVASEALPYAKTGGLADVIEALPKALVKLGHEVAVFLPRYHGIKATKVIVAQHDHPAGPAFAISGNYRWLGAARVRYFFLEDPAYFDREGIYGTKTG